MKHEKFINFITDISVGNNEYLGESIMEAYGLCFYGVSLRNEADKLLESINGNKALCEAGVLETMRKWPRKKIMGLLLGALITMTAAKGMAADNPQVIDGARDSVIEQLGGSPDGDGADALEGMLNKVADKFGDKIEEKAAEKGGQGTETAEDDKEWDKTTTDDEEKRPTPYSDAVDDKMTQNHADDLVKKLMTSGKNPDDIKGYAEKLANSDDDSQQELGNAINKALAEWENNHKQAADSDTTTTSTDKYTDRTEGGNMDKPSENIDEDTEGMVKHTEQELKSLSTEELKELAKKNEIAIGEAGKLSMYNNDLSPTGTFELDNGNRVYFYK